MKNLEEKKLLVKMSRMLGQPVDPALLESIEREENLNKLLFKEEKKIVGYEEGTTFLNRKPIFEEVKKEPEVLVEVKPPNPEPAPAFVPPVKDTVQQVINVLASAAPPPTNKYRDAELEGMRRTIAEMMQKISTMSWGGGGTGIVRIGDADDFDRYSYGEGRYLKWSNGMFRLDEINPYEVVHNTTAVTSTPYFVTDTDYYIGVNVSEYTTIVLPLYPSSGRTIIVKDESGHASINPIKLDGTIDNDAGGAEIQIDNGALQLIYRDGWRIV